jgi:hypothetical protein
MAGQHRTHILEWILDLDNPSSNGSDIAKQFGALVPLCNALNGHNAFGGAQCRLCDVGYLVKATLQRHLGLQIETNTVSHILLLHLKSQGTTPSL